MQQLPIKDVKIAWGIHGYDARADKSDVRMLKEPEDRMKELDRRDDMLFARRKGLYVANYLIAVPAFSYAVIQGVKDSIYELLPYQMWDNARTICEKLTFNSAAHNMAAFMTATVIACVAGLILPVKAKWDTKNSLQANDFEKFHVHKTFGTKFKTGSPRYPDTPDRYLNNRPNSEGSVLA